MRNSLKQMIDTLTADPARMLPAFKEAYPGITDGEALQLALTFTGLFKQPGQSEREHKARQREYSAALDAAGKKYPGGAFPSIEMPALEIDLPGLDFDL